MKHSPRWMPWIAVAGILAGAGVASAWRSAPAPMAAPATVGVIRLGALMDGLTETSERQTELQTRHLAAQADVALLTKEIEALEAQLSARTLQGEDIFNAMQILAEKQAFRDARDQASNARLDLTQGAMMRQMYEKILVSVEQFAQANGYDMIVVDDRTLVPLAPPMRATTAQHLERIQARRVLYVRPNIDVTDQVIVLMNNQWEARGGDTQ